MIPAFTDHLWQSTLLTAVAGLLVLALRGNRARTRYWVWLAASVKFLVPFRMLVTIGGHLSRTTVPLAAQPRIALVMRDITEPFARATPIAASPAVGRLDFVPVVAAIWISGAVVVILRWLFRWWRIRAALRAATPLQLDAPIEVMSSRSLLEPGVFGIFRPVLLLPEGITERLTPDQLRAILAHELSHVRQRDNLTAAIHMLVEAIFWFHPLVWWIGARMVEERERACDEEVLLRGAEPEVYAEGILRICKFYVESPLDCAAGVTGSNLQRRIETIMENRVKRRLDFGRKVLLAAAGVAAVAGPVAIGVGNAPEIRAQSQAGARLEFEVASVKTTPEGTRDFMMRPMPGGLTARNIGLKQFIQYAYDVKGYQLSGGPGWLKSETFDIEAKMPAGTKDDGGQSKLRLMLQGLLADRFKLALSRETKELPVYAVEVRKGGPKLHEVSEAIAVGDFRIGRRGHIGAQGVTLAEFAGVLSGFLDRPVVDHTGLKGKYDFTLEFTPDEVAPPENPKEHAPNPDGASIFTAIQEQLGLRLVATKAPMEMLVINHVERPTQN